MKTITLSQGQEKLDRYLEIRRMLNGSEVDSISVSDKYSLIKEAKQLANELYSLKVEGTNKSFLDTYTVAASEEDTKVKGRNHVTKLKWFDFTPKQSLLELGTLVVGAIGISILLNNSLEN